MQQRSTALNPPQIIFEIWHPSCSHTSISKANRAGKMSGACQRTCTLVPGPKCLSVQHRTVKRRSVLITSPKCWSLAFQELYSRTLTFLQLSIFLSSCSCCCCCLGLAEHINLWQGGGRGQRQQLL